MTTPRTAEQKAQVQELYLHLDHTANGNVYLAWYGQLRAEERTHAEALAMTIDHFHLATTAWYQARKARKEKKTA